MLIFMFLGKSYEVKGSKIMVVGICWISSALNLINSIMIEFMNYDMQDLRF
jgi:hypothetical protein